MLSARPWNLEVFIHLLMAILFCVCFAILGLSVFQQVAGKEKLVEGSLLYLVAGTLSLHGSILLGTAAVLRWHRIAWREMFGFFNGPVGRAMLLGVLVCAVFLPVGMLLQEVSLWVLSLFHVPTPPQEAVAQFEKAVSPGSRAYLVMFDILPGPFAEEVFFRGILYGARQFGRPRLALWGSAIVFSAMHGTAAIFLPLLVFGLMQAWLYEKTDNLLATITSHSLFNGVNVIWMFYGDSLVDYLHGVSPHLK